MRSIELKVKIKSLAEEARIIRKEENKLKSRPVRKRPKGWERALDSLHDHRVGIVRRASRETHLAYAFLRGRALHEVEQAAKTEPNWAAVQRMVSRYGGTDLPESWRERQPVPEAA